MLFTILQFTPVNPFPLPPLGGSCQSNHRAYLVNVCHLTPHIKSNPKLLLSYHWREIEKGQFYCFLSSLQISRHYFQIYGFKWITCQQTPGTDRWFTISFLGPGSDLPTDYLVQINTFCFLGRLLFSLMANRLAFSYQQFTTEQWSWFHGDVSFGCPGWRLLHGLFDL